MERWGSEWCRSGGPTGGCCWEPNRSIGRTGPGIQSRFERGWYYRGEPLRWVSALQETGPRSIYKVLPSVSFTVIFHSFSTCTFVISGPDCEWRVGDQDIQYCEMKKDIYISNKHHASDHQSFGPVFAFAAASSSLKDPLRRHIFLKIPPTLLMRFQGVSNSTIYQCMIRVSNWNFQKADETTRTCPLSRTIRRS